MNITLEAEEFWEAFCEHNADLNKEELYYDVWQFLDGKRGCDRLASLCLAGIKTATSSVYETFEIDDMKVPEAGDFSIILDSDEVPLFILKDTNVEIKKFSEIEEEFAAKEGEGDQSLEGWKKIHRKEFEAKCEEYGIEFSEDTLILCEEFEVVFQ